MNIYKLNKDNQIPENAIATIGMFDGVHLGHKKIISFLKEKALELNLTPIVLTFNKHPRHVLHNDSEYFKLLNTEEERYQLLENYGINNILEIDFTPETAALSTYDFSKSYLLDMLNIKALVIGYDNMFGNKKINDFHRIYELGEKYNFDIFEASSYVYNNIQVSSTQIRNALNAGNIELANAMLGYNYFAEGCIIKGRQIGRTIGFPTANIELSNHLKMLPKEGVYATIINLNGTDYIGMANIGTQPTFESYKQSFEIHILNFNGDIYGQSIEVRFIKRIRDIQKFDRAQSLMEQLQKDKNQCLQIIDNLI
ncbi:MAG: riboflavin biosynthesis protein RibF [Bacteroidales bacterium]|mgnify:CR=1 FL=1|nr:riboflavin biosynthesis protein RibF [Bacteroidales bacterium]